MKIYLLNPPFVPRYSRNSRWAARCRGGALYYPIWLSYTAGLLEKEGYNVRLIDAPAWDWNLENVKEDAKKFKPDLIVAESNFQSLTNDVVVAKGIKTELNAVSVLVGPPTSQFPERILNICIQLMTQSPCMMIYSLTMILSSLNTMKNPKR